MSRTKPTDLEQRALGYACSTCQADPRWWCSTVTGALMSTLHGPRFIAAIRGTA